MERPTGRPRDSQDRGYAGSALRATASQMEHHDALTGFAAVLTAEAAHSQDYGVLDLLPTSRSSIGYYYHGANYVVHPDASFTLDPVAASIVKEIFESSHRGNGLKEICKELNGRGITHKGRRWQKNVVHYLLTNEAYTGTAVWGVKSKDEKAPEPVRVKWAWPALVSCETFDVVQ